MVNDILKSRLEGSQLIVETSRGQARPIAGDSPQPMQATIKKFLRPESAGVIGCLVLRLILPGSRE